MNENERLDPPEDAPVLDAEDREIIRERASEALGHEPCKEEMAEWLQENVEGY